MRDVNGDSVVVFPCHMLFQIRIKLLVLRSGQLVTVKRGGQMEVDGGRLGLSIRLSTAGPSDVEMVKMCAVLSVYVWMCRWGGWC